MRPRAVIPLPGSSASAHHSWPFGSQHDEVRLIVFEYRGGRYDALCEPSPVSIWIACIDLTLLHR